MHIICICLNLLLFFCIWRRIDLPKYATILHPHEADCLTEGYRLYVCNVLNAGVKRLHIMAK
jgi:hypothetical protein